MHASLAEKLIHVEFALFQTTVVFMDGFNIVAVPLGIFDDFLNQELEDDDIMNGCIDFEYESYIEMLNEPEVTYVEVS